AVSTSLSTQSGSFVSPMMTSSRACCSRWRDWACRHLRKERPASSRRSRGARRSRDRDRGGPACNGMQHTPCPVRQSFSILHFCRARWEIPGPPADFPPHVARIFGDARLRHTHWVLCVAYSPNGKRLASASQDGTVKVWDVETRRELRTYTGHTEMVRAVAFSPDGKLIASAGGDKDIRLWEADTGKDIRPLKGHTEFVTGIAFSPDGTHLASGGADRK